MFCDCESWVMVHHRQEQKSGNTNRNGEEGGAQRLVGLVVGLSWLFPEQGLLQG